MAPKQPPIILPPNLTLEKLIPVQQLLHLTVHRNKNQHRITKWWGNLQLLRRNLKRLVEMLQSKEAEYRRGKEDLLKMANWMEAEIIPKVYLSFSAVVADNQYASLGLMLMGCLARINACLSFPRSRVPSEEVDVEVETGRIVIPSEDMGEAITREAETLVDEVLGQTRKAKRRNEKTEILDGEPVDRSALEVEARPKKSIKREVLDIEESSEDEERQPAKKAKKVKKVSKKFVEEFDHLSGNSSSDEEAASVFKKANKAQEIKPTPGENLDSDEVKPAPKQVKKVTSSLKAAKPPKKKKKKGGDDLDDLFAGLM